MAVKTYSNGHFLPLEKVRDICPKKAKCTYLRIASFDPLAIPSIVPEDTLSIIRCMVAKEIYVYLLLMIQLQIGLVIA